MTDELKGKFNRGLRLVQLSLLVTMLVCCNKQVPADQLPDVKQAKNLVSMDDAKSLLTKVGAVTKSGRNAKFTEIDDVTQVNDSVGSAVFYAVNYKGGGFVLLSADNRTEPVWAIS